MCTQVSLYAFRWNLKALLSIYFVHKAVLATLNLPFILFYAALSYMTKTMALHLLSCVRECRRSAL